MGEFFGSLYCLFEDFFGLELANYLWGQSSTEQMTNMFIGIGYSMLAISAFAMILFYYIFNRPKWGRWMWALFGVINAVINFLVGWQWVLRDYYAGYMVRLDPATNQNVPLPISEGDIICFGVSNAILSFIVFFIFSCLFKWWSTNVSRIPF